MSEQVRPSPHEKFTASTNNLETDSQGEAVIRLLETPEVRAGIAEADAAIASHYRQLEEAGNTVHPLFEGVTPDGTRLVVAEYTDAPTLDQKNGEYARGAYPSFPNGKFSVFAYPVEATRTPDFAKNLAPNDRFGEVSVQRGSGVDITVERPEDPMPMTKDEAEKADDDTYHEWAERNVLHIPQVVRDTPRYRGQKIVKLADATFTSSRQETAEREVAPLRAKQEEHLGVYVNAIGNNPELEEREKAAADELKERARETIRAMKDNPVMVDQPNTVHDKAKAEYMASEMNGAMGSAVSAKNESGRTKHLARAEQVAARAEAQYNTEPLGVFNKPTQAKGLFGFFRKK